jgi:hypothetical protein
VADTDFAQRLGIFDELLDEILGAGRREGSIEMEHQQMRDAEVPDQRDLVLGCRQ